MTPLIYLLFFACDGKDGEHAHNRVQHRIMVTTSPVGTAIGSPVFPQISQEVDFWNVEAVWYQPKTESEEPAHEDGSEPSFIGGLLKSNAVKGKTIFDINAQGQLSLAIPLKWAQTNGFFAGRGTTDSNSPQGSETENGPDSLDTLVVHLKAHYQIKEPENYAVIINLIKPPSGETFKIHKVPPMVIFANHPSGTGIGPPLTATTAVARWEIQTKIDQPFFRIDDQGQLFLKGPIPRIGPCRSALDVPCELTVDVKAVSSKGVEAEAKLKVLVHRVRPRLK